MFLSTAFQMHKDREKFFFTLSPSLTISVSTTNQVNIKNIPEKITTEIVGEEHCHLDYIHYWRKESTIHLRLRSFNLHRVMIPFAFFWTSQWFISDARLEQLFKDNNIKLLKIPPLPKPAIQSAKDYPRMPEQIFNELKKSTVEIVDVFVSSYTPRNWKKPYVVTLKQCDDFISCIFWE